MFYTKWVLLPLLTLMFLAGCAMHENIPTAAVSPELGAIPVRVENTRVKSRSQDFIPCGTTSTVTLLAGQHIEAGTVTISNSDTELRIVVQTALEWEIGTSHLHLALNPADFPVNGGGNPQIGHFDYIATFDPLTSYISYTFLLSDIPLSSGDDLYIAFHAEVFGTTGEYVGQSETAWGEGPEFPGKSWAMYMQYVIQACENDDPDDPEVGLFRTQTQGGWGTVANGNNPGSYRDVFFTRAFPQGVTIGSTQGYSVLFTSSSAVAAFLPQGTTAGSLSMSATNPLSTDAGVFAGQVLALTLSVGFDLYDEEFGASTTLLGDATIADMASPFYGMTVQAVLTLGQEYLSTGYADGYLVSQLNEAISKINESYVDGFKVTDFI
jgi:hypothetical protein